MNLSEWQQDSARGNKDKKPLTGIYAHWCGEWDEMPVDETTPEFQCCSCYSGWRFLVVRWLSEKIVNLYLSYCERQARRREERQRKTALALVSNGAITVNEAREMCGLSPLVEPQAFIESRAHMATLELESIPPAVSPCEELEDKRTAGLL